MLMWVLEWLALLQTVLQFYFQSLINNKLFDIAMYLEKSISLGWQLNNFPTVSCLYLGFNQSARGIVMNVSNTQNK